VEGEEAARVLILCIHRIFSEQLFYRERLRCQGLLVGKLDHGLEIVAIVAQALVVGVFAEKGPFFLQIGSGECEAQTVRLLHELAVLPLHFLKSFKEARCDPRIAVQSLS